MPNIYDMADTWNNAATVFTAIKMNVTDTASNASSLLMDLQVGGASVFRVDKNGQIRTSYPTSGQGIYLVGNGDGVLTGTVANQFQCTYGPYGPRLASNATIRWSTTTTDGRPGNSLALVRDASNELAQQNGVNPQTFRVYNTYTDASNYERGFIRWASNFLEIGAEAAGTGTLRAIKLIGSIPTSDPAVANQLWNDGGTLKISAG